MQQRGTRRYAIDGKRGNQNYLKHLVEKHKNEYTMTCLASAVLNTTLSFSSWHPLTDPAAIPSQQKQGLFKTIFTFIQRKKDEMLPSSGAMGRPGFHAGIGEMYRGEAFGERKRS